MRIFIHKHHDEEFMAYLGLVVESIKDGKADQDKFIAEVNKEMRSK